MILFHFCRVLELFSNVGRAGLPNARRLDGAPWLRTWGRERTVRYGSPSKDGGPWLLNSVAVAEFEGLKPG